jgi:hypothetical protein
MEIINPIFDKKFLIKYNNKYLSLPKRGKNYSYSEIIYSDNLDYQSLYNFLWKIKIINNNYYIYNINGLILIVNNIYDFNDPFHFSTTFHESYKWSIKNNNLNIFIYNNCEINILIE